MVGMVEAELGPVDLLVNSAGYGNAVRTDMGTGYGGVVAQCRNQPEGPPFVLQRCTSQNDPARSWSDYQRG